MPANNRSSQKEVSATLKQIDCSVRQFEVCWEQLKSAGCGEEKQKHATELRSLHAHLQRSQAQLRPQSTHGTGSGKSAVKVADALSRIADVTHRFQDFEHGLNNDPLPTSLATGDKSNADGKHLQQDARQAPSGKKVSEETSSDEVKVQWNQLIRDAEGDDEVVPVDELICKICQVHVVGCNPKLTTCSHLFCGDCIAKWFDVHPGIQSWAQRAKSAGPGRVVPCPVCKVQLHEGRDLHPVCAAGGGMSSSLWQIIASLKIACCNHPRVRAGGRCRWIGEYGAYHDHIKAGKCECAASPSSHGDPVSSAPVEKVADTSEALSAQSAKDSLLKALVAFVAADSSQLTLDVDDFVEVLQQHSSGWTYGRKACLGEQPLESCSSEGWFPDWVVWPRRCTDASS